MLYFTQFTFHFNMLPFYKMYFKTPKKKKGENRHTLSSLQETDHYLLQRKGNRKAVNNKF